MPWWSSSRRGDDCSWPSHMERRSDGSTKVRAKKPPVLYVDVLEEGLDQQVYLLRNGSDQSSVASSVVSSIPSSRVLHLPPAPLPPIRTLPHQQLPAAVVTVDFPDSCSTRSLVGGSETESDGLSQSGSSSSSSSRRSSRSSKSILSGALGSTVSQSIHSRSRSVNTANLAPTVVTVSDDGDDGDADRFSYLRSSSPVASTASSSSRHSRTYSVPAKLPSSSSSSRSSSSSGSASPLPPPREPSPSPPSPFLRPPASSASSDNASTAASSTASRRSKSSARAITVDIVDCEPPSNTVEEEYSTYSDNLTSYDSNYAYSNSSNYSNYDSYDPTLAIIREPGKPIALRRTLTRTQPLPRLQPIQTDFSSSLYSGYSPYSSYASHPAVVSSSVLSPSRSCTRVRRASRAPTHWTVKTPKTPKTPRTPRLIRPSRAVRMQPRKKEKPRIVQAPRASRTPRTPKTWGVRTPIIENSVRGRPMSPTGSYVRTESMSRERRRQRRATLAAKKAEVIGAITAIEAAQAAHDASSVPRVISRSRRSSTPVIVTHPKSPHRRPFSPGTPSSSHGLRRRSSSRFLRSSRPLVIKNSTRPRKSDGLSGLSRYRTEPIRSPIVDVRRSTPRTPRRTSATASFASDPRVREDATWGDYLGGRPARRPSFPSRPSRAPPKRIFGGYYESESRATARSMRPVDDLLSFLKPRGSGSVARGVPMASRRTAASMAPRMAAARREATRKPREESFSSSWDPLRSHSRSRSRVR